MAINMFPDAEEFSPDVALILTSDSECHLLPAEDTFRAVARELYDDLRSKGKHVATGFVPRENALNVTQSLLRGTPWISLVNWI